MRMRTDVNADLLAIMQARNVTFHFSSLKVILRESCQEETRDHQHCYGGQRSTAHLRHVRELGNLLLQPQTYKYQFNLLQIISKLIFCKLSRSHFFDLAFVSTVPQIKLWENCWSVSPETVVVN